MIVPFFVFSVVRNAVATELQIAVVVPCSPQRLFLDGPKILKSLSYQTQKPKQVVLAASGYTGKRPRFVDDWPFSVSVVEKNSYPHAGQSRNIGKDHVAKTGEDIIAFLDSDDPVHPQWLEYVLWFFTTHSNVDILLGRFLYNVEDGVFCKHGSMQSLLTSKISAKRPPGMSPYNLQIHNSSLLFSSHMQQLTHGDAAIRTQTSMWTMYQNEIGEDSHFLRSLMNKGAKAIWTEMPVICYKCSKIWSNLSKLEEVLNVHAMPTCWSIASVLDYSIRPTKILPRKVWTFWFGNAMDKLKPMSGDRLAAFNNMKKILEWKLY